ncbi:MAG TPA: hypothetical protein VLZ33_03645 [Dysgonamonadaceae bacterium]|nr:hypothetical protein [Dysgonamonadaceae bacterium]
MQPKHQTKRLSFTTSLEFVVAVVTTLFLLLARPSNDEGSTDLTAVYNGDRIYYCKHEGLSIDCNKKHSPG